MVQDIFVTKNRLVDKTGEFQEIFEDGLQESFLFSKGDESWARKRKACAHAFYKDRLENMMDVLKEKLSDMMKTWNSEIEASSDGQTIIDIGLVFERLFCRNIVQISFGEDVSDMKIETDFQTEVGGSKFIRKTVTMPEAMNEYGKAVVGGAPLKNLNPIY